MCRQLICFIAFCLMLSLAGGVQAARVKWTGAGPDQLWSTPTNWDTGTVPTSEDEVRIELTPGPIITTQDAVANALWGSGSKPDEVTIDGGALTVGSTVFMGRHVKHTTITVNSGVMTVGQSISVGYNGSGTLIVNGGMITIGNTLEISRTPVTQGHVDLRGGTISTRLLSMRRDEGAIGTLDMGGGALVVDGNCVSQIRGYIDNGWITAYQGRGGGTLQLDYDITNKDKTTLKAIHSLRPNPLQGSSVHASVNQLQWTLPEPNQPGGVVTCDVYFGTNPRVEQNPKIVVGKAMESASITLDREVVYYWALDIYDSSVSATEPVLLGPIFTFDTKDMPPAVYAGKDVVTWLAEGVRTGNLDATVTDDYSSCTVQWTVVSEPNDPNNPGATVADPRAEDTSITLAVAGTYIVQVEASDGKYTSSDTLTITVYNDRCEAAQSMPGYLPMAGDLNGDCKVDDVDLALLQENWLKDSSLVDE